MNIILFEDNARTKLLPLTYTRPVAELRIGILTIREKWEGLGHSVSCLTEDYLQSKFGPVSKSAGLYVNARIIPTTELVAEIGKLKPGNGLKANGTLLAYQAEKDKLDINTYLTRSVEYSDVLLIIDSVTDIFTKNGEALQLDFDMLTKGRKSEEISSSNTVIGNKKLIFLEKGAKAEASVFNTTAGPIYIGKNAEVMEGCLIRGPFALCEESVLKMSCKVYGPSTIGPHSKVGGEINNSVIFGYSNKAHDGFLGNSVVGEWCNLGADTNNSNLKNNYGNVKLFDYSTKKNKDSGLQFCGLIMADHSKCGINTMFNTGTVVGVGANIFGGGFPPTHIPSFSWGGSGGFETYHLDKMFETTERVLERRKMKLTKEEKEILKKIFNSTVNHRYWD